jgi:hypothetical protein
MAGAADRSCGLQGRKHSSVEDTAKLCFTAVYTVVFMHEVLGIGMDERRIRFANSFRAESGDRVPLVWSLGAAVQRLTAMDAADDARARETLSRMSHAPFGLETKLVALTMLLCVLLLAVVTALRCATTPCSGGCMHGTHAWRTPQCMSHASTRRAVWCSVMPGKLSMFTSSLRRHWFALMADKSDDLGSPACGLRLRLFPVDLVRGVWPWTPASAARKAKFRRTASSPEGEA